MNIKDIPSTLNFIPGLLIGKINKNPLALTVNIGTRLLSLYLCFEMNTVMEVKSMIIAILFPSIYVIYMIATHGIDNILDIFGLETDFMDDIFEDTQEQCIEKRGQYGDQMSIIEDRKKCGEVVLGLSSSKNECENILSVGSTEFNLPNNVPACKYISGDTSSRFTRYSSCSDKKVESDCISVSGNKCEWNEWSDIPGMNKRCDTGKSILGWDDEKIVNNCPIGCAFIDAEDNHIQIDMAGGWTNIQVIESSLRSRGVALHSTFSETATSPANARRLHLDKIYKPQPGTDEQWIKDLLTNQPDRLPFKEGDGTWNTTLEIAPHFAGKTADQRQLLAEGIQDWGTMITKSGDSVTTGDITHCTLSPSGNWGTTPGTCTATGTTHTCIYVAGTANVASDGWTTADSCTSALVPNVEEWIKDDGEEVSPGLKIG